MASLVGRVGRAREVGLLGENDQELALAGGLEDELIEHPGVDLVAPARRRDGPGDQRRTECEQQSYGAETQGVSHGKTSLESEAEQ